MPVLTLALALVCSLQPDHARAGWIKAQSAHFTVLTDADPVSTRDYVERLEVFDGVVRMFTAAPTAVEPPVPLTLYWVRDLSDLRRVDPDTRDNTAGFYSAGSGGIIAMATRGERQTDFTDTVLFHEYVHHYVLQNNPSAYPAWFSEGIAEYFGGTRINDRQIEVGNPAGGRVWEIRNQDWIPLEALLTHSPSDFDLAAVSQYYAQAWLLTHFMLSNSERKRGFDRYLRAVASGEPSDAAMRREFGELPALQAQLKAYMRSTVGYVVIKRAKAAPPAVEITALPESAKDFLLDQARVRTRSDEKDDPAFLQSLRKRAAKYPGDRLVDLTLAEAEISMGDPTRGEDILGRLLKANPDDPEALHLSAQADIRKFDDAGADTAALRRSARTKLARAHRNAPDDWRILQDYVFASSDGYPPTGAVLDALLLAHQLAPQVESLSYNTGLALLADGQPKAAIAALKPVANAPHGGGLAEAARKLIVEAEASPP